ncbi:MAG: hypothetical protein H6826_02150 [Planctomycetes bacterium]|nr:hypothetical protein [Planctomycetota bacterium]
MSRLLSSHSFLAQARPTLLVLALPLLVAAAGVFVAREARAADKTLDQQFAGRVSVDKKGVVTLRYDFRDQAQLADWETGAPFRIYGEKLDDEIGWFDGHLDIPSKKGARLKAAFTGDVTMEAKLRVEAWSDLGAWFAPADGAHDYVIYTLVERYFHKWDAGQTGGQHSIIQFGDQWREGDVPEDFVGFRYISRRPANVEHKAGELVPLVARWVKNHFEMAGPDGLELEGKPKGPKLGNLVAGFYTAEGRLRVDEVVITGRLSPAWLKEKGVRLELSPDAGRDPALAGEMEAHAGGDSKATRALVARLRDPSLEEAVRTSIEEALSKGPKRAVSAALDLLYDGSVEARTSGIAIVKAHMGKDFGYNPKANESRREAALKKITDAIQKDPELSGS